MRLPVVVDISCHHLTTIAICLLCSLCIGREIVVEQRLISENKQPYNNEPKKRHQRQHNINFQFYMSQLLHFHWAKPFSLAITIRFRDFSLSLVSATLRLFCAAPTEIPPIIFSIGNITMEGIFTTKRKEKRNKSRKKKRRDFLLFSCLF